MNLYFRRQTISRLENQVKILQGLRKERRNEYHTSLLKNIGELKHMTNTLHYELVSNSENIKLQYYSIIEDLNKEYDAGIFSVINSFKKVENNPITISQTNTGLYNLKTDNHSVQLNKQFYLYNTVKCNNNIDSNEIEENKPNDENILSKYIKNVELNVNVNQLSNPYLLKNNDLPLINNSENFSNEKISSKTKILTNSNPYQETKILEISDSTLTDNLKILKNPFLPNKLYSYEEILDIDLECICTSIATNNSSAANINSKCILCKDLKLVNKNTFNNQFTAYLHKELELNVFNEVKKHIASFDPLFHYHQVLWKEYLIYRLQVNSLNNEIESKSNILILSNKLKSSTKIFESVFLRFKYKFIEGKINFISSVLNKDSQINSNMTLLVSKISTPLKYKQKEQTNNLNIKKDQSYDSFKIDLTDGYNKIYSFIHENSLIAKKLILREVIVPGVKISIGYTELDKKPINESKFEKIDFEEINIKLDYNSINIANLEQKLGKNYSKPLLIKSLNNVYPEGGIISGIDVIVVKESGGYKYDKSNKDNKENCISNFDYENLLYKDENEYEYEYYDNKNDIENDDSDNDNEDDDKCLNNNIEDSEDEDEEKDKKQKKSNVSTKGSKVLKPKKPKLKSVFKLTTHSKPSTVISRNNKSYWMNKQLSTNSRYIVVDTLSYFKYLYLLVDESILNNTLTKLENNKVGVINDNKVNINLPFKTKYENIMFIREILLMKENARYNNTCICKQFLPKTFELEIINSQVEIVKYNRIRLGPVKIKYTQKGISNHTIPLVFNYFVGKLLIIDKVLAFMDKSSIIKTCNHFNFNNELSNKSASQVSLKIIDCYNHNLNYIYIFYSSLTNSKSNSFLLDGVIFNYSYLNIINYYKRLFSLNGIIIFANKNFILIEVAIDNIDDVTKEKKSIKSFIIVELHSNTFFVDIGNLTDEFSKNKILGKNIYLKGVRFNMMYGINNDIKQIKNSIKNLEEKPKLIDINKFINTKYTNNEKICENKNLVDKFLVFCFQTDNYSELKVDFNTKSKLNNNYKSNVSKSKFDDNKESDNINNTNISKIKLDNTIDLDINQIKNLLIKLMLGKIK